MMDTKEQFVAEQNQIEEAIVNIRNRHVNEIEPYAKAMHELRTEFGKKFAPHAPGSVVAYNPHNGEVPGKVEILAVDCVQIPDRFEYHVKVIDVGDSRQKDAIGRFLNVDSRDLR